MNGSSGSKSERVRVLAIDAFHGGSHRAFIENIRRHSIHDWTLVTGKPVHWKWRMRSAPLELARMAVKRLTDLGAGDSMPERIFCTDMLDLPSFLGLAAWHGRSIDLDWFRVPTTIYFHENQWTYPLAPTARPDFHYGYTNLVSALSADQCLFNSAYHRDDFVAASARFLARMPDSRRCHDLDRLRETCRVVPPGFSEFSVGDEDRVDAGTPVQRPVTIGWVSRWESDKRPDRLFELLRSLEDQGADFRLILLGPRSGDGCQEHRKIVDRYADRIRFDGFADSIQEYRRWLAKMDFVVSTADHEFFGIAICEAIWAGAIPVVPNRLSYPELVAAPYRYDDPAAAARMILDRTDAFQIPTTHRRAVEECRKRVEKFQARHVVRELDDILKNVAIG